jgi:peptidoglycan-N-acetylglucosamine deacetylase
MKRLQAASNRFYNAIANRILRQQPARLSEKLSNSKNLFLYFNYEREFSGHKTDIKDDHIIRILDILDNYGLKTTWYIVGKILEVYPESVREIVSRGHELGSHTYAHIALRKVSFSTLKKDFTKFHSLVVPFAEVKGFHYPNNLWSLRAIRILASHGYSYDLVYPGRKKKKSPSRIHFRGKELIRLCSSGDDWPLYGKDVTEDEVFRHFSGIVENNTLKNSIIGVGFHPWILFSSQSIFNGFSRFLEVMAARQDIDIRTALDFVSEITCESNKPGGK